MQRLMITVVRRFGGFIQVSLDSFAWISAVTVAVLLRFDFSLKRLQVVNLLKLVPIVIACQLAAGLMGGLYRRKFRYGSFDEVAALTKSTAIATVALFLIDRQVRLATPDTAPQRLVPISATVIGGFVGLVGMAGIRYCFRLGIERLRRPDVEHAERLLVFGAGEGGTEVIKSMKNNPLSPWVPVGLIDDDPARRRLTINRVPVVGTRKDIAKLAMDLDAKALLIAMPSAGPELVKEVSDLAKAAGLAVKVLPPLSELFGVAPTSSDIRDLTEEDLLGRHQVKTNVEEIGEYLRNKVVLVTGAGGSIGSELCRQIARFDPKELIMLDRDESALHGVQLSIDGHGLLDTPNMLLADIRDAEHLKTLFMRRRPHVVFHAAALKHLPMLEQYPGEALKSNVWGTLNVLDAAVASGVERFVNISTDKAADPISVLGYSKRIAERLSAHVATTVRYGTYLSVRFGNVLGSRGSVLVTFRDQISRGGPITVTDPNVTRYFMTIPEAVQLVVQAGAIGGPGEVLVLDMGKPVRIDEVAKRMIAESGKSIDIRYTGLRHGEKLHEDLLGADETDVRPRHPLISHAVVPPLHPDEVLDIDPELPTEKLVHRFTELCETREIAAGSNALTDTSVS
jgi:FlaA1/EpsC-like NDP-sugar epimerase